MGNTIGVDINNPQYIGYKLDNIKKAMNNPKNIEKTKEILNNVGKYVEVGIEAAAPIIEKTTDKIFPIVVKETDKAVKAGLNTGVNLLEDVLGPLIGIPRTLTSAAEAFNASVNAGSELIKGTSEIIQGTHQNMNRILNEQIPKINIPNTEHFTNNLSNNISDVSNNLSKNVSNMSNNVSNNISDVSNNLSNNISDVSNNLSNNVSNKVSNLSNNLNKYKKERIMIGGRTNKSQLEFLSSHVKKRQTKRKY